MLTDDDKQFIQCAKKQASSKKELHNMLVGYAEETQGDCLLCKQLLLRELLEAINVCG
jgi:hypothetical protein